MLNKQIAEILLSIYSDKELSTEKKIELATVILDKNSTTQINHFYDQSYQTQPWDLPIYPNLGDMEINSTVNEIDLQRATWTFNINGTHDLTDLKDKKD